MRILPPGRTAVLLLLLALAWICPSPVRGADKLANAIQVMRDVYSVDRATFLSENLVLTEQEGQAFWPLYRKYRASMESLGDELVKLVLEYADTYPNTPDDRARELLKRYSTLEKKLATERDAYLKKISKVLPAVKALRFAQLESRMDLALRAQLASVIPVTPAAGKNP